MGNVKSFASVQDKSKRAMGGFTLIEMLISIALVLVMMILFAQVFQMAGGSIGKMRAIAQNDQRARSIQTVIKADLDKRTFRFVYPFAANEDITAPVARIAKRQGYLYISENNPYNSLDDVLQFTVSSTITVRNTDPAPYVAHALYLPMSGDTSPPSFRTSNQPDADDGQRIPNDTGSSTAAEIAYFVRNGNLYRRQLSLREPIPLLGGTTQPTDTSFIDPVTQLPTNPAIFNSSSAATAHYPLDIPNSTTFWGDFDYSAYLNATGAQFIGTDALDNSSLSPNAVVLARTEFRFGFSPSLPTVNGILPNMNRTGLPKEFLANSYSSANAAAYSDDLSTFIGRFTMEETSHVDFGYPHFRRTAPFTSVPTDPNLALSMNSQSIVNSPFDYSLGSRRGEDLVLSNVHSFDIKVWDEGVGRFVDLGDQQLAPGPLPATYPANADTTPALVGDYWLYNRLNPNYGPRVFAVDAGGNGNRENPPTVVNAVFDTWHHRMDSDHDQLAFENPPFRPLKVSPNNPNANLNFGTFTPPVTTVDTRYAGTKAVHAYNGQWQANYANYSVGDIIFPRPSSPKARTYFPFYYQCIQAGTTDATNEPDWPLIDGQTITEGLPGSEVKWQAVDNTKPLKAIQIQVRFLDTTSQQIRQVTITHSLVD